jgi:chlorophyllide a oxygenase
VVECVQSDAGLHKNAGKGSVVKIFDVEDPRGSGARSRGTAGTFDVNMAWELLRQDVLYLDWKARQDVLAIVAAHEKVRTMPIAVFMGFGNGGRVRAELDFHNGLKQVVEVLNPLVRDKKSVETLRSELAGLQDGLSKAHAQVMPCFLWR